MTPKLHYPFYQSAIFLSSLLVAGIFILSITIGNYTMHFGEVINGLFYNGASTHQVVLWQIRIPRSVAAILTGAALGLSGMATQSLLQNPLASPFTLGISQGAAFGAAFAIVVLNANAITDSHQSLQLYSVTLFAFLGALSASLVILILAGFNRLTTESIILAGVALSSLFTSGTILIQYFATETEIATIVFWTFGDVSRSDWNELNLLFISTIFIICFFSFHRWNLNAVAYGDETAKSLGVSVDRLRLAGMMLASLLAALATAFHGVIAFLGLLAPHIARKLAGPEHGRLTILSCLIGSLLLLTADTAGRFLVSSGTLPVGVLTSFMGAPLFLYLLLKGLKQ